MKVSILIPVFNAAATLPDSLGSVGRQDFDGEIEICAVDDCSNDGGVTILNKFKTIFERTEGRTMKILRHKTNCGVAAARNTALDSASGDLILWLDADDRLPQDALKRAAGAIGDADLLISDWTLSTPEGERYMRQPDCSTPEEALKAIMGGTLKWNLWIYCIRREMFDGVRFQPGMNMGEDLSAIARLIIKAWSVRQIHESNYCYRQTTMSISRTMSDENLRQTCANLDSAAAALLDSKYSYLENPYLDLLKLNVKLPLLVSDSKNDYLRWALCYPEASRSIMKNEHLPLRTKLLQWAASKRMWITIFLYNKLVYGIIYKVLLCGKS